MTTEALLIPADVYKPVEQSTFSVHDMSKWGEPFGVSPVDIGFFHYRSQLLQVMFDEKATKRAKIAQINDRMNRLDQMLMPRPQSRMVLMRGDVVVMAYNAETRQDGELTQTLMDMVAEVHREALAAQKQNEQFAAMMGN